MFELRQTPLDLSELVGTVSDSGAGAIVTFVGTTRDNNEGRRIYSLEYEAYSGMAEQEIRRVAEEAGEKWDIKKIAVLHRVGDVPIGEASVMIAVASPHRDAGFKACRYVIDELKKRVPIWKKEIYEGGEVWIGTQSGERRAEMPRPG